MPSYDSLRLEGVWTSVSSLRGAKRRSNPGLRAQSFLGPGLLRFARNDGVSAAHRLDIVAVGVDQERGVIGRAVVCARARRAVVAAAGLEAFGVKFVDRGMVGCAERDMRTGGLEILLKIEPERGFALRPETCSVLILRT